MSYRSLFSNYCGRCLQESLKPNDNINLYFPLTKLKNVSDSFVGNAIERQALHLSYQREPICI